MQEPKEYENLTDRVKELEQIVANQTSTIENLQKELENINLENEELRKTNEANAALCKDKHDLENKNDELCQSKGLNLPTGCLR